jgi:hypothetical protein
LRKLFVSIVAALCIGGLAGSALASTTINWTGQGSENLPCGRGGHWVLTGKGVTSATLTVGSHTYTMVQNGGGSFSADSVGFIVDTTVASASYEGTVANGNPQLVLSSCVAGYSS